TRERRELETRFARGRQLSHGIDRNGAQREGSGARSSRAPRGACPSVRLLQRVLVRRAELLLAARRRERPRRLAALRRTVGPPARVPVRRPATVLAPPLRSTHQMPPPCSVQ